MCRALPVSEWMSGVGGEFGVNSTRMDSDPSGSFATVMKTSVTKLPRTLRLCGEVRKKAEVSNCALTARPECVSIA